MEYKNMTARKNLTRTKDIATINCQRKEVKSLVEGMGYVHYECPFCHAAIVSVKWSLQGTGKACVCGALFKMYEEKITAYKKEVKAKAV